MWLVAAPKFQLRLKAEAQKATRPSWPLTLDFHRVNHLIDGEVLMKIF